MEVTDISLLDMGGTINGILRVGDSSTSSLVAAYLAGPAGRNTWQFRKRTLSRAGPEGEAGPQLPGGWQGLQGGNTGGQAETPQGDPGQSLQVRCSAT